MAVHGHTRIVTLEPSLDFRAYATVHRGAVSRLADSVFERVVDAISDRVLFEGLPIEAAKLEFWSECSNARRRFENRSVALGDCAYTPTEDSLSPPPPLALLRGILRLAPTRAAYRTGGRSGAQRARLWRARQRALTRSSKLARLWTPSAVHSPEISDAMVRMGPSRGLAALTELTIAFVERISGFDDVEHHRSFLNEASTLRRTVAGLRERVGLEYLLPLEAGLRHHYWTTSALEERLLWANAIESRVDGRVLRPGEDVGGIALAIAESNCYTRLLAGDIGPTDFIAVTTSGLLAPWNQPPEVSWSETDRKAHGMLRRGVAKSYALRATDESHDRNREVEHALVANDEALQQGELIDWDPFVVGTLGDRAQFLALLERGVDALRCGRDAWKQARRLHRREPRRHARRFLVEAIRYSSLLRTGGELAEARNVLVDVKQHLSHLLAHPSFEPQLAVVLEAEADRVASNDRSLLDLVSHAGVLT